MNGFGVFKPMRHAITPRCGVLKHAAPLMCLITGFPAFAQDRQPTLDELLDIEPANPAVTPEPDPIIVELPAENPGDTFAQAVAEMDRVSLRLGRQFDPGIETQRLQEDILAKLDRVIAAAKQQQSSSSSGSSSSSSSSARQQDSGSEQMAQQQGSQPGQQPGEGQVDAQTNGNSASQGAASVGTVNDPGAEERSIDELRTEWGNLPPRLRNELSEGLSERFSPVYRDLTEAYYRRLAEEE